MATCMICGKGPHHGTTLFRQNPKGEAGIWACMAHSQQIAAPEVNKLVAVIERDAMDQPTTEAEQIAMRRGHAAGLH